MSTRTTLRADADTVREGLPYIYDHDPLCQSLFEQPGLPCNCDISRREAALAALARLVEAAEHTAEACSLCGIPRATGECSHIIQRDGRVTMSERAWERLVEELARLRNAEAEATDA